jgi:charged multivesicular body protein 4
MDVDQVRLLCQTAHLLSPFFQVHDLMDDIHDQQEVAKEISEAISNPIGFGNDLDEDELLAELEELEQEELDKQLLDVAPAPAAKLPDVPAGEPSRAAAGKAKTDHDDLAELEAWANA